MWHDIQQNTEEWELLRSGKLTGSAAAKVMANYPKAFGEPAKKLAVDIALSQLTGKSASGGYSNEHTERGHEQEPLARIRYEDEYFCNVTNGGFFDNGFTGCSPDGIVAGTNGIIEIKSVIPSVHYKRIKSGTYDPTYRWQLVFNLKESEADWIDYISFCADFTEDKKLFVHRMHRAEQEIAFKQMEQRIDKFKKLVDQVRLDIAA